MPTTPSKEIKQLENALNSLNDDPEYKFRKQRTESNIFKPSIDGEPSAEVDALEVLRNFRYSIMNGVMPDIETLLFLNSAFLTYLDAKGGEPRTLDAALGIRLTQRVGTDLQQSVVQQNKNAFFYEMFKHIQNHPECTQSDAFDAVKQDWLNRDLMEPLESHSCIRGYQEYYRNLIVLGVVEK